MLTITDSTSGKIRKYATSDSELVESLFNEGEGTLNKLHKKETRGDALLFWTDEKAGVYLWKPSNLWGKFTKLKNGRLFYQYTLDSIDYI